MRGCVGAALTLHRGDGGEALRRCMPTHPTVLRPAVAGLTRGARAAVSPLWSRTAAAFHRLYTVGRTVETAPPPSQSDAPTPSVLEAATEASPQKTGADFFWRAVTPCVPDWRRPPPTAIQWLRKYLRTLPEASAGTRGGPAGPGVTARLFSERRVRMARREGGGEDGEGADGSSRDPPAALQGWGPGEVKLRRVPAHYPLPPGAWLCVPRHLNLAGATAWAGADAGTDVATKPTRDPGGDAEGVTAEDARLASAMVLYRDADVMVINKPAGLPTVPGPGIHDGRSVDGLRRALTFDAAEPPRLVHRLDRDTSGCMVLARTPAAAYALAAAFRGKAEEAESRTRTPARGSGDGRESSTDDADDGTVACLAEGGTGAGSVVIPAQTVERTYWALVSGVPARGLAAAGAVDAAVVQLTRARGSGEAHGRGRRGGGSSDGGGMERMGTLGPYRVVDGSGQDVASGTMTVEGWWPWVPDAAAAGGIHGRPATSTFRVVGVREGGGRSAAGGRERVGEGAGAGGVKYLASDVADQPVLLELIPQTGRKHQLRVHCAQVLGCPIVGDYKHGYRDVRRRAAGRRGHEHVPEWKETLRRVEQRAAAGVMTWTRESDEGGEEHRAFLRERAARRAELAARTRLVVTRRKPWRWDDDEEEDKTGDADNQTKNVVEETLGCRGVYSTQAASDPPRFTRGDRLLPATPSGVPLHLHARRLTFTHPRTGETVAVTAPAPPHLLVACEMLGIPLPQDPSAPPVHGERRHR